MQARIIISATILLLLLVQCKKSVSTIMPEPGEYDFSVNIKDFDADGKLRSENKVTVEAVFSLNATGDTLLVQFDKLFEPVKLAQGNKSQIVVCNVPQGFVINNLDCHKSLLRYKMVHKTSIQQYIFEGKKR